VDVSSRAPPEDQVDVVRRDLFLEPGRREREVEERILEPVRLLRRERGGGEEQEQATNARILACMIQEDRDHPAGSSTRSASFGAPRRGANQDSG